MNVDRSHVRVSCHCAEEGRPADVAKVGWEPMNKGDASIIYGMKNKLQVAAAGMMTDATTAKLHREQAEPGSGSDRRHN